MAPCTPPCVTGTFESVMCTNGTNRVCPRCSDIPSNASYIGTWTKTPLCPWTCDSSFFQNGSVCDACPANSWCSGNVQNQCPTNTKSDVLSSSQGQCLCIPGYYGNGSVSGTSPCPLCLPDHYCPGGNNNVSISCPGNYTSPAGSSALGDCICLAGYQLVGSKCLLCPAGGFCESGQLNMCPANSFSPEGSSVLSSCVCNPGFYGSNGDCTQCPANSYCTGGTSIDTCVVNAVSPPQSASHFACYCDRGYQGVNNSECVACEANTWCWTGVLNQCPDNTASPPLSSWWFNCVCLPGYTWPDGYACSPCPGGTYKGKFGNISCTDCPEGQHCKAGSVAPVISSAGHYSLRKTAADIPCPTGAYQTGVGSTQCDMCGPGSYQSSIGSTTISDCTLCASGTYSTASGVAACTDCPEPCAPGTYETTSCGLSNNRSCSVCGAGSFCAGGTSTQVCLPGM
jgi:hypothetical protein